MPANVLPIYSRVADIQWVESIVTAHNVQDLTSGTSYLAFTADSTNGGFVSYARVKANPANNTAATVVRIWINNGSTVGTATNSALFTELALPATTTSATAAQSDFTIPLNLPLPPGYKLYVTIGTAPGGSGEFTVTVVGGKY
jgi:hypothetical protein